MRRKDGRGKEEGRGGFFDFPPTQRISSIPSSLMASPIFHRLVISNSNRPSSSSLFSPSPCNRSLEAGEEGKATSTSGWRDAGCLLAAGSALIKAAITVIAILLLVRTCSRPSKLSLTDATLSTSSVIASLSGGNFSHRIPRSPNLLVLPPRELSNFRSRTFERPWRSFQIIRPPVQLRPKYGTAVLTNSRHATLIAFTDSITFRSCV